MRSARHGTSLERFLGVRLTREEVESLDRFGASLGLSNRSDTIRHLVREARAGPSKPALELPTTLHGRLEEAVEDGLASDIDGALTLVVTLGLAELCRLHAERWSALRSAAREAAERRRQRRSADREGRGLLER